MFESLFNELWQTILNLCAIGVLTLSLLQIIQLNHFIVSIYETFYTNESDNKDNHMASDESSSATIEIMYWIHRRYTDYFHQQQINTFYKAIEFFQFQCKYGTIIQLPIDPL